MVLIRNAEVGGQAGLDVRVGPDRIEEVGTDLARGRDEETVDAAGGAVIPGLHDHHVHLRAVVAARQSADASAAADPAGFDALVRASAPTAATTPASSGTPAARPPAGCSGSTTGCATGSRPEHIPTSRPDWPYTRPRPRPSV